MTIKPLADNVVIKATAAEEKAPEVKAEAAPEVEIKTPEVKAEAAPEATAAEEKAPEEA